MATQKVINDNPQRNNGGTITKAGKFSIGNATNSVTLRDNAFDKDPAGVIEASKAGQHASSGNLGTKKTLTGGVFGKMETGEYVAKKLGNRLAQTDNATLKSGAADFGQRRAIYAYTGYQRIDLESYDLLTGTATYGDNRGVTIQASGIDGTVGRTADDAANPTYAVPGELVYMKKGVIPTQDDYAKKTSP